MSWRRPSPRAAALALAGAFCAPPSWAQPEATSDRATTPCRVPGIATEVRCGVVRRPLDAARPAGPQLDIHYLVVPAIARRRLPDPVFLLAGGPGQSAVALAPAVLPLFARLNNRRDIVFVDQRGTGTSMPLVCDDTRHAPLAEAADTEAQMQKLRQCLTRLARTAPLTSPDDLRFFTTPLAMQDLDAVRAQLGAARINLVGASYGTRAALEYARQFPTHLRRSVLDGVAPPDMVLPASTGTDTQTAFDAMLADCAAQPACAARHPNLRADWAALLASLPKPITAAHPLTGVRETFTLDADHLLGAVRGPLYAPTFAAALPEAISQAAAGRYEALLGLSGALSSGRRSSVAMGMHFSVLCAEDRPRLGDEPAPDRVSRARETPVQPFADHGARLYRRVCDFWPRGALPAAFYQVAPGTSATLLLSGGLDPATPPRHAARVASALGAKALPVVVAHAGHGLLGLGCVREVVFKFIDAVDDATALAVDTRCVADIPRPPVFAPVRPITLTTEAAGEKSAAFPTAKAAP